MASIQRIGFTRSQNDLSKIFKALGHPARIAIIELLISQDRRICKEIALDLNMKAPTVTHHLQVLTETGMIGYEKIGNTTCYVVNTILVDKARVTLSEMSAEAKKCTFNYSNTVFAQQPLQHYL